MTIATNMAGPRHGHPARVATRPAWRRDALHQRGINPAEASPEVYEAALAEAKAQCADEHEAVVAAGGLHIIGTERHDARRIDNQLRGRAGRQGDPGSSRFYLSLEDDLMKRFASDRVAGLMERMGLEEDVAIESKLVSRTIESAQTRVEGYNFDIRKRVVEYDDVINKQRETIYAERDKVLRNEDLTETVRTSSTRRSGPSSIATSSGTMPRPGTSTGSPRPPGRSASPRRGPRPTSSGTSATGRPSSNTCATWRMAASRRSSEEHGAETWALVERIVLLRAIDALWVEHLTELDDMRRGIGLRGYSGEDPLNAFKKEAFSLYEQLRDLIQHQVASTIFRVNVVREEPAPLAQPLPGPGMRPLGSTPAAAGQAAGGVGSWAPQGTGPITGAAAGAPAAGATPGGPAMAGGQATNGGSRAPGAGGGQPGGGPGGGVGRAPALRGLGRDTTHELMQQSIDGAAGQARPAGGPKLGRNDPCYCGSGLKYKKCHGR